MQNMPNQTQGLIWNVLQHIFKGYLHLFDLLELNQHHFRANHYSIGGTRNKERETGTNYVLFLSSLFSITGTLIKIRPQFLSNQFRNLWRNSPFHKAAFSDAVCHLRVQDVNIFTYKAKACQCAQTLDLLFCLSLLHEPCHIYMTGQITFKYPLRTDTVYSPAISATLKDLIKKKFKKI